MHIMNPSSIARVLAFLAFSVFIHTPLMADNKSIELKSGQEKSEQIKTGDVHSYLIKLESGQFIAGEAMQITADVRISIVDPNGKNIAYFDGPSIGKDPFQFNTKSGGIYKINISPFEKSEGKYSISVLRAEPTATTKKGKIDQIMFAYNNSSPGGVIAVVRKGKIIFSNTYGLANIEYNIPNKTTTPYHTASLSKQFTAFAMVLLDQQKKLSLDDSAHKYLPDLPKFDHTITLRHLLNHTSGLRDHWDLWVMAGGLMDDVIRQKDLIALIKRQQTLNFAPGEKYLYSNTGYLLLSEVVSKVTQQPFSTWMQENIFKPLDMNSTFVYDNHEEIVKNRAYSYYNPPQGLSKSILSYANFGSTSIFTTAEDLAKWLKNFHRAKVGGKKAIQQLQEEGVLNNDKKTNYALGMGVGEYRGLRVFRHYGIDAGFRTRMTYYPKIKSGVILLGNTSDFDTYNIEKNIADIFFSNHLRTEEDDTSPLDSDDLIPDETGKLYKGYYQIKNGGIVDITLYDGKLYAKFGDQAIQSLIPSKEHTFRIDEAKDEIKVTFILEPENKVSNKAIITSADEEKTMQRILPWEPSVAELAQYGGRYFSEELETFYSVKVKDEQLIISHIRHGDTPLKPSENMKNNFDTEKWYLNEIKFSDDKDGSFQVMYISSHRSLNLKFIKIEQ